MDASPTQPLKHPDVMWLLSLISLTGTLMMQMTGPVCTLFYKYHTIKHRQQLGRALILDRKSFYCNMAQANSWTAAWPWRQECCLSWWHFSADGIKISWERQDIWCQWKEKNGKYKDLWVSETTETFGTLKSFRVLTGEPLDIDRYLFCFCLCYLTFILPVKIM